MPKKAYKPTDRSKPADDSWNLLEDPCPILPEMEALIKESGLDILTRVTLRTRARRPEYTVEKLREAIAWHQRMNEEARQRSEEAGEGNHDA